MSADSGGKDRGFFAKYWKYLLAFVAVYIILILIFTLLSRSDKTPFQYQVF
jgi:hypothetical protein